MIKRLAAAAGTYRPRRAVTAVSGDGGSRRICRTGGLERAQQIAEHRSPKTAQLYDRTADRVDRPRDRTYRDLTATGLASPRCHYQNSWCRRATNASSHSDARGGG